MTTLYILHSKTINKYYIGQTQNIQQRIVQHNTHHNKKGFTKAAIDWEVVFTFENQNKTTILKLERFIKRMKSPTFIKKIITTPDLLQDIITANNF